MKQLLAWYTYQIGLSQK